MERLLYKFESRLAVRKSASSEWNGSKRVIAFNRFFITMNLYCHVTEDTLISEMSKFEAEEPEKGVNRQISHN